MQYNFREALEKISETISYYRTPEGMAERFLKQCIDAMAYQEIPLKEIDELYFVLVHNRHCELEYKPRLCFSYVPKGSVRKVQISNNDILKRIDDRVIFSAYIGFYESQDSLKMLMDNLHVGLSVFSAIIKIIQNNGIEYEDILKDHCRRDPELYGYIKITL